MFIGSDTSGCHALLRRCIALGAILLFMLSACSQKERSQDLDEGTLEDGLYTSAELGWSIRIPPGWEVMSKDVLAQKTRDGLEYVADAIGTEVDYSGIKFHVSFQKDDSNSFQSTSELFDIDSVPWEENNKMVKEALFDTYYHRGIPADTSSTTAVIDGLNFDLFRVKIFNRRGNVILNQDICSRLISGYAFSVIVNYNNESDRQVMEKAFRESAFSNR